MGYADIIRQRAVNMGYRFIDEVGNQYGEYTVIQFDRTDKKHTWYKVKCSCGKEEIKRIDCIKSDSNARCRECKKKLRRSVIKNNEIDLTDKTYNGVKVIKKVLRKILSIFLLFGIARVHFVGKFLLPILLI